MVMKVKIEFHDNTSFTVEEVVKVAETKYGKSAKVTVLPDSHAPHDLILFALQQIITNRQLQLYFDKKYVYQKEIAALRGETLVKLGELLDTVIMDNEAKVA